MWTLPKCRSVSPWVEKQPLAKSLLSGMNSCAESRSMLTQAFTYLCLAYQPEANPA